MTSGEVATTSPRNGSNTYSGDTGVYPIFPVHIGPFPPILSFMIGYYSDFTDNTDYTISRYGVNRTYRALRLMNTTSPNFVTTVVGLSLQMGYIPLILFE
jgi:hypothetical protein